MKKTPFLKTVDSKSFTFDTKGEGSVAMVCVESLAEPGFFRTTSGAGTIQYDEHSAEVHNYLLGEGSEKLVTGFFKYPVEYFNSDGKSLGVKQFSDVLSKNDAEKA